MEALPLPQTTRNPAARPRLLETLPGPSGFVRGALGNARPYRDSSRYTHRAGTQFGQLWGAVYLCDYAAQEPFRRSDNRLLDRGESVHQLARIIHNGPIRSDRGRRREEKFLISGALTLLTNAVSAYNMWKLHQAVERRRAAGRDVPPDAILAHISPIGFRHINFHGVYRFPLDRYVDRLMPSTMPQAIVVGG
jgi:Tn3 transposase DDE domain